MVIVIICLMSHDLFDTELSKVILVVQF